MVKLLPCIRVEPAEPARTSVIWLHGLGADGSDFENIIPEMRLPHDTAVRLICPHAPGRHITINNNQLMRAWYDVASLEWMTDVDRDGIYLSVQQIHALIDYEQSLGIPAENIIIAGFSQGGAVAIHAAARYREKLGGVIALSCYLPMHMELSQEINPVNRDIPIFMAHGNMDPMIPIEVAQQSCSLLRSIQPYIEWREYNVDHHICEDEIVDIRRWLQNLPAVK